MVTFLSDFGLIDPYVAEVKGRMLELCDDLVLVDMTHSIPPGDIIAGAFLLARTASSFAEGTVHLAVVDPGVGTERTPLAVLSRDRWFVGPDNGLLSMAADSPDIVIELQADMIVGERPVSRTFHARDVFGPAAARLARGDDPRQLGKPVETMTGLEPEIEESEGEVIGEVVWVDHFGNAITAIKAEKLAALGDDIEVRVASVKIRGLSKAFGEVEQLAPLAYIGSGGTLELAVRDGDLAERFGVDRGLPVVVRSVEPR